MNDRQRAREMLEENRILWGRDWDAIAFGFTLGASITLGLRESGMDAGYVALMVGGILATWIGLAIRMTRGAN